MEATMEVKTETVINVGPDRVTRTGEDVLIEAKHPMSDWQVRELNPVPVYFEDRKYHLLEEGKAQAPFAQRYLLRPWPEGESTNVKAFYVYDAETVAEREAHLRRGHLEEVVHAGLFPFYPFLGLLWSGTQKRLQRFGFVPHSISGISIFTIFSLLFAEGVFVVILLNASLRSGKIMIGGMVRALVPADYLHLGPISIPVILLDALLALAFVADVCVRFGRHFQEDQWAGGFLEWLVPRRSRERSGED
jgi:hypothetical protein